MNEPILRSAGIRDVSFGERVTLIEPVNLYGCTLADDVFVGPFVEIQANVSIGHGSRIQSHSFICEQVTIGERCFIGHGVMFANDLFRGGAPDPDPASWGRTVIEDGVAIGSNATILPVRICRGAVIGAGAVVTRDILIPGTYAGNPARLLRAF
ncbi:acyltransferase [Aeromonas sp. sif2433]|uniref:acyltransferase n=1 Tax=Aeromonas sp. sif2433 TaxID=2854794 RepID=UPI001C450BCA|nr:acyltransferase [Aeromonas sp. sif2433]MBV7416563.1 N-acetyltransferase [Aeromonas sp. sif2433]